MNTFWRGLASVHSKGDGAEVGSRQFTARGRSKMGDSLRQGRSLRFRRNLRPYAACGGYGAQRLRSICEPWTFEDLDVGAKGGPPTPPGISYRCQNKRVTKFDCCK